MNDNDVWFHGSWSNSLYTPSTTSMSWGAERWAPGAGQRQALSPVRSLTGWLSTTGFSETCPRYPQIVDIGSWMVCGNLSSGKLYEVLQICPSKLRRQLVVIQWQCTCRCFRASKPVLFLARTFDCWSYRGCDFLFVCRCDWGIIWFS